MTAPQPQQDVEAELRDLQARNEKLNRQLAALMEVYAKLEITGLEHSLYFSNQKRLMDFVQRVTMKMDNDDDLMELILEELLIELKADRVSCVLVGESAQPTWTISQEAVDRGIKRAPLPYFVAAHPPGPFVQFLQRALKQPGAPTSREWSETVTVAPAAAPENPEEAALQSALGEEHNSANGVECRAAMAFPVETTLGGTSLFCVQRVDSDQGWTRQQKDLFQNMCRYAGSLLDQTQLSAHVRDLKDQLDSLIESMPSAIIGMDLLGTVTTWNSKAAEFFEIPEEEALGEVLWEIVPSYAFISDALKNAMEVEPGGLDFEPRPYRRLGGKVVYLRANLFTMFGRNRGEVGLRIDDVTRTVELNHQLFHSQKMEIVGALAGGMAHEFNEVLGGMVSAASLMKERALKGRPDPGELMKDVEAIESSATRASAIVKRLLALSKKADITMEPMDLNTSARNITALCRHSFASPVQVIARLPEGELWILGDRSQLEQAILNICVNARDAMKTGGTLTLSTGRQTVDDAFRQRHPACSASELAWLDIRDTGEGIPLEILDKIFDPFFTTKRENGSGLGLAITDSIVQQHKGFVDVESDSKMGTHFKLYFQISDKTEKTPSHPVALAPGGGGEILVVDNDEIVRGTAARILEELGYTVATAANGASAIRMLDKGLRFDLVVLDVDMPVMNGLDTAAILRRGNPGQRILLCAGRLQQPETAPSLDNPNTWMLAKPFDMAGLAGKVREALNGG